jgi:hypothetical protein
MTIDVAVGDVEVERELASSLRRMGCPSGESWSAMIAARGSSWELLLEGPPRRSPVEWQAATNTIGNTCYRRLLQGSHQRTKAFILRLVRDLVLDPIQFRENPIRQQDQRLGEEFEEAVLDALRHQAGQPLDVRFNVWREGDVLQFVCKVEGRAAAMFELRELPWRWWSPLVRTPAELGAHLRAALRARRSTTAEAATETHPTFGWGWSHPMPASTALQN